MSEQADGYRRVVRALRLKAEAEIAEQAPRMVGRKFWIYHDGKRIKGEVVGFRGTQWIVRWEDGEETEEHKIDPAADCPWGD